MAEALNIVVLTVSDTRTAENDTSGDYLVEALTQKGHQLLGRSIVIDDIYRLRLAVSESIADPDAQVILLTGGTGFTGRDSTPEAIGPLLDTRIDGFGELFHCPMCMVFWVGAFLFCISGYTELFTFEQSITNLFICGWVSSGTSYIMNVLFCDNGLQMGVNNGKNMD